MIFLGPLSSFSSQFQSDQDDSKNKNYENMNSRSFKVLFVSKRATIRNLRMVRQRQKHRYVSQLHATQGLRWSLALHVLRTGDVGASALDWDFGFRV